MLRNTMYNLGKTPHMMLYDLVKSIQDCVKFLPELILNGMSDKALFLFVRKIPDDQGFRLFPDHPRLS